MEINTKIKAEDLSSDCEYGVINNTQFAALNSTERMVNVTLKDELKSKILERRKKEGKSEIKLEETHEPKKYSLTKEEVEKCERRKVANRIAARKCRNKKKLLYNKYNKDMREQLRRRQELVTAIPELEKEIADIRYLWRLISIPGTTVESSKSEPDKGVAITVDSEKAKVDIAAKECAKFGGKVVDDDNGEEKDEVILKRCGIRLIIPKSLKRKEADSESEASSDDKGSIWSDNDSISEILKKKMISSFESTHGTVSSSGLAFSEGTNKGMFLKELLLSKITAGSLHRVKREMENIPTDSKDDILLFDGTQVSSNLTQDTETKPFSRTKPRTSTKPHTATNTYTSPYETVIETSSGKERTVILGIPTVVNDVDDDDDENSEKSCDGCETLWSETSGMKLRTLVTSMPENMELEEVSSVDNFSFNFRSGDENAPHSLSSSQSSNLQVAEYEGYEEMKPEQPILASAYSLADDSNDSDSDIELIELEEPKLVIDLTG